MVLLTVPNTTHTTQQRVVLLQNGVPIVVALVLRIVQVRIGERRGARQWGRQFIVIVIIIARSGSNSSRSATHLVVMAKRVVSTTAAVMLLVGSEMIVALVMIMWIIVIIVKCGISIWFNFIKIII